MVKAVIFDCFGVLIDGGFEHTYRLAGGDPKADKEFTRNLLGQYNLGMISHEEFNQDIRVSLGVSEEDWNQAKADSEMPNEQLLNYIVGLRAKYKTAILSNAGSGAMLRRFGTEKLQRCFDEVIVSSDVGLAKPDPRIYQLAASKLNLELYECVFVDDMQSFLDAASQLGMQTILYGNFEQFREDLEVILDPKD